MKGGNTEGNMLSKQQRGEETEPCRDLTRQKYRKIESEFQTITR